MSVSLSAAESDILFGESTGTIVDPEAPSTI